MSLETEGIKAFSNCLAKNTLFLAEEMGFPQTPSPATFPKLLPRVEFKQG